MLQHRNEPISALCAPACLGSLKIRRYISFIITITIVIIIIIITIIIIIIIIIIIKIPCYGYTRRDLSLPRAPQYVP